MSRIKECFDALRRQNKKALVGFITPGVPEGADTVELALSLSEAGCDILELGIPFSDPAADGPVIQRASDLALRSGVTPESVLSIAAGIRSRSQMPLLFLMYYNTIYHFGVESFAQACMDAGIDGLIVPDLPYEEQDELLPHLTARDIDLITLAAPTSGERLGMIVPSATGFVYCVSTAGVTGERSRVESDIDAFLARIGSLTATPRAVGFGISTPEQARRLAPHCEGVIVGSGLVRRLMDEDIPSALSFISSLRRALDDE